MQFPRARSNIVLGRTIFSQENRFLVRRNDFSLVARTRESIPFTWIVTHCKQYIFENRPVANPTCAKVSPPNESWRALLFCTISPSFPTLRGTPPVSHHACRRSENYRRGKAGEEPTHNIRTAWLTGMSRRKCNKQRRKHSAMSCYEFSGIKACSETHCMRVFSSFPSYSNIGILDQLLEMGEAGDEMSEIEVWHGMAWHGMRQVFR